MVLQCCVETTNRTRCRLAYMRTLFHGDNTTRRERFLPNKAKRRYALSEKELSVRPPSHTVLPSVVALIPPVRASVIYFASPRVAGASFMPPCIFPVIYNEAGMAAARRPDCVPQLWPWRRMRHGNEERASLRASCAARVVQ